MNNTEETKMANNRKRNVEIVNEVLGGKYNAVLINQYLDGSKYVGWHSDDDYGDPEPTIPMIVLGASRPFQLRKKGTKIRVEYQPGHGDLLVMRGKTNSEWQHTLPKTKEEIGMRISLTFRYKPTAAADEVL
jgi:alkylated DNA repair dioxygenase AlkB